MKRDTPLLIAVTMTGLAALALEVLWSRAMIPWVGGTALSQITTVGIYMGGLFLGSAIAVPMLPRIADPRATYMRVEIVAAVLSLAAVLGLPLADPLFALFSRGDLLGSGLGSVLRGLAGGGLMLPATVLMGFSFPLAVAALDRGREERGSAALAYGFNTIGATIGTLIGGFVLVPKLGVVNGAIAIVVADLVVLIAIARTKAPALAPLEGEAARTRPISASAATAATERTPASGRGSELPMLASILLGGMVSLGLEAILFRVLGLLLGPTARAFTVVLAVYVLGLGIGSLLVRRIVARGRVAAEVVYLACWLVVGGYGLLVHAQTGRLSELVASGRSREGFDLAAQLALRAGVATLVLLPLTCAFGASYSAAVAAATRTDPARASRLYAALTLGNILGLAVAAWGVLPNFRLDRGLLIVIAAAFIVPLPALAATSLRLRTRVAVAAALIGGAAFARLAMPEWPMRLLHTAAYMYDSPTRAHELAPSVVRFHKSAFETSVTVVQKGEHLFLQLDGKTTGSTTAHDRATQGLLATIPAALHHDPKSVFVIGLGTGQTPAEALRFPVERVDCAEISPEVVLTMDLFELVNRRCDLDARFRMLEADGRTVLRYGGAKYDVVISEPSNVWIPGVAHLFTKESFEDVRSCLAERGLCVQWMQGYGMQIDTLRTVVRTFLTVFPNTSLWYSGLASPDVFMVGSVEPLEIDVARLERRLAAAAAVNANDRDRPLTPVSLLRSFIAGPDALRRFAGEGPLTSDARPSLEYAAESALISGGSNPAWQLIAEYSEPPVALIKGALPGRSAAGAQSGDGELARTLERRAQANRALAHQLRDLIDLSRSTDPAHLARLFTIADSFKGDPELESTIIEHVAHALGDFFLTGQPPTEQHFELIRGVIRIDPDHPESLKLAALLAVGERRFDDAIALFEKRARTSPSWMAEPYLDLGRLLSQFGRYPEAVAQIRQALARNDSFASAWMALAETAAKAGDTATAAEARRAIERLESAGH